MDNSQFDDSLYQGLIATGSMFANLADGGSTAAGGLTRQISLLQDEISPLLFSSAAIRLYISSLATTATLSAFLQQNPYFTFRDDACDVTPCNSSNLFNYISDSGRIAAQLNGISNPQPSYDNLLIFFPAVEKIPTSWQKPTTPFHYYTQPFKGMNRRAKSELQKYLKTNKSGCILSIYFTAFNSSLCFFPGTDAKDILWNILSKNGGQL